MLFKDMKPGYPVYILQKEDGLKAVQGKVINVSQPYFPQMQPGQMPSQNTMQRMTDVTIEADGRTNTFAIPETLSVTYAGNMVLSTDRDGVLKEVESIKSRNDEELRLVAKREKENAECEKILEEWNPAFAEKKEQDKRITGIEHEVKGMKQMLAEFINEFKK